MDERVKSFGSGIYPITEKGKAVRAQFQKLGRGISVKKNTYRHESIDYDNEIRVLKILHGSPTDKLECNSRFVLLCSLRLQSAKASVTGKQV
jgi:hypothetical protein